MSPLSFSVSRFAMGGLAMLSILYIQRYYRSLEAGTRLNFLPSIARKDWPRLLIVSLAGATFAPWLGIEGLEYTHGARASLWLALGPALSTGMGFLFGTEKLGKYGYAGILFAGLGTLVLAYEGIQIEQGYWLGDLLLFLALCITVLELHMIKPLASTYGSINIVALRTLIGGSIYILIASQQLMGESWLNFGFWTWFAILAGGGIGVGVGQWIQVRALRSLGPTKVVIYGNLVPIAAMLIAWVSIGVNPTFFEVIAGIMIIGGAFLIQVVDAVHSSGRREATRDSLPVAPGPSSE